MCVCEREREREREKVRGREGGREGEREGGREREKEREGIEQEREGGETSPQRQSPGDRGTSLWPPHKDPGGGKGMRENNTRHDRK